MAVTAHWCEETATGDLTIRSELVALKYARGVDSIASLAKQSVQILQRLGPNVINKIGTITAGDSANNDEMLWFVTEVLKLDVPEHHLSCFSRALNIAMQTGLQADELVELIEKATNGNRVVVNASLSNACHPEVQKLAVELSPGSSRQFVLSTTRYEFPHTDTGWGKMLFLLERLLDMQSVICDSLTNKITPDVARDQLNDGDWSTLRDIRDWLRIAHQTQSSMNFKDCGTTSRMFTVYNELKRKFRAIRDKKPILTPAIDASIFAFDQFKEVMWLNFEMKKIYNYSFEYAITKRVDSYMFSMIINPTIKFSYFTEEGEKDVDTIRKHFVDLMLEKEPKARKLSESDNNISEVVTEEVEKEDRDRMEAELDNYLDLDIRVHEANLDLLAFWKAYQKDFPHIYAIALDLLPIQVSAVSCERVFTRSDGLDSLLNDRMSFGIFEILQHLKYSGGKANLYDTVWSNLDIEDALKPSSPPRKCTLSALLESLADAEYDYDLDDPAISYFPVDEVDEEADSD